MLNTNQRAVYICFLYSTVQIWENSLLFDAPTLALLLLFIITQEKFTLPCQDILATEGYDKFTVTTEHDDTETTRHNNSHPGILSVHHSHSTPPQRQRT